MVLMRLSRERDLHIPHTEAVAAEDHALIEANQHMNKILCPPMGNPSLGDISPGDIKVREMWGLALHEIRAPLTHGNVCYT